MTEKPMQFGSNIKSIRPLAEFLTAISFLTRLPVPFSRTLDLPPLAVAMRLFPVAGALIGGLTALPLIAGNYLGLPALLSACLALGVATLVTGALHEDGLADVADGFWGGTNREDRLAIMHDSRIGTYGTIALAITYLARASVLEQLFYKPSIAIIVVLASSGAFSRALMVDLMWATRPARSTGLSAMAGRPSRPDALFALLLGGIASFAAIAFMLSPERAAIGIVAAGLALAAMRALAMAKIGGQTGDVCGATQVVTELAMLSVFVAIPH
jgi:adenosylcobinamide-GDP ribazoletransferase